MDLLTASEVATLLGYKNRQRVHQLAEAPGFPEPAFERERIRLWWRDDIERWAANQ